MWQTVVILVLLALVLIYVVQYYIRVFRPDVPLCSGCTGCCGAQPGAEKPVEGCERGVAEGP